MYTDIQNMSEIDAGNNVDNVHSDAADKQEFPHFEEWKTALSFQLTPDSPRNLHQLYEDIYSKKEVALITNEMGETLRYGKVAAINVFFETSGKKYKLEEHRYKLNPGRTIHEFLAGDISAVTESATRPALSSLSERIKLDGEAPSDATIRALHEEIFDEALKENSDYPDLDETLRQHIHLKEPIRRERAKDEKGNSYQGIASLLDEYHSTISFTPDMHVPIQVVNDIPQGLREYDEKKGYVNLFEWQLLEPVSN